MWHEEYIINIMNTEQKWPKSVEIPERLRCLARDVIMIKYMDCPDVITCVLPQVMADNSRID